MLRVHHPAARQRQHHVVDAVCACAPASDVSMRPVNDLMVQVAETMPSLDGKDLT